LPQTFERRDKNGTGDFFGEPIFTYTDQQAVNDDVPIPIAGPGRINRVTRAVFDHFTCSVGSSPTTGPVTKAPCQKSPPAIAICERTDRTMTKTQQTDAQARQEAHLYHVTWEIELSAVSPAQAAQKALAIQRNPESYATVFDVADGAGNLTRIDLAEISSEPDDLDQKGR
jgi:hypothetical protein